MRVRYSVAPEKVRVVLDLPATVLFTDQSTAVSAAVLVESALPAALPVVPVQDAIVTSISVTPTADGKTLLALTMTMPRKVHVFSLPAGDGKPFRVVVDVLKRFETQTTRSLSSAITYTRLERQTDDAYLVAHTVDIDATDPHIRFGVTAAQGGRERVSAMAARAGAVCGVNGGYFLDGTRPVGLLKTEGQVLALPLWGRTAAAFPPAGPPIFANPTGAWRVTLPDGTVRDLPDKLEGSLQVPPPTAVVAAGQTYVAAPKNPHGVTLVVRDNRIICRTSDAVALNPCDFAVILSDEDDDRYRADCQLAEGTPLCITPVVTPDWTVYTAAVGAGPRLLREGQIAISADAERFQPDIRLGHRARTSLGVTANGHVLLLVVEAPCPYGGGATLEEEAALLQARGAMDAMNLDGGGSATLALDGQDINYPAGAWVRPVADSVLVYDSRVTPVLTIGKR